MGDEKYDPIKGEGWVGHWSDGALGWAMPDHLQPHDRDSPLHRRYVHDDDVLTLCKITVEPIYDVKGRPVRMKAGALRRKKRMNS